MNRLQQILISVASSLPLLFLILGEGKFFGKRPKNSSTKKIENGCRQDSNYEMRASSHPKQNSSNSNLKSPTIENKSSSLPIKDENLIYYDEDIFESPVLIYHDSIDDVVRKYSDKCFIIKRLPDWGISTIYLIHCGSYTENYLVTIHMIRRNDDSVLIEYNGSMYQWFPNVNILVGTNNALLVHFRQRPIIVIKQL
ncbi:Hypothetical protein HVR_LOCUS1034 [uncultured virus]|nr:Hypothetical protein HVR_LOCUS1034 [uncultured virus]